MRKVLIVVVVLALIAVVFTACKAADVLEVMDKVDEKITSSQVTLSAPENVRVEGGVLSWNPVEHAIKYKVSIDGKEDYSENFSYVLPNMVDGEHSFKVLAIGDDAVYLTSAYSEPLIVTFKENAVTRTGYYSQFDDLTKQESFLGYGFDVINSAVFCDRYAKTSFPIFKTDELMNLRLLKVDSKSTHVDEIKSEDIDRFMQEWTTNANVGVSWGSKRIAGSVQMEARYSGGYEEARYKYYQATCIYCQKFYIVMQADINTYRSMLSDGFMQDLYSSMSPADLFNNYGTHFITSAVMGGRINSYYLYTSNDTSDFDDVVASLSVEASYISGKTDVAVSGGYYQRDEHTRIYIKPTFEVIGGGDYGMMGDRDIRPNYADWEKSLDDHASLMGIKDSGSLVSIWSLIDPTKDVGDYYWDYNDGNGPVKVSRAQQLEAYFYRYGTDAYNDLMRSAGLPEIVKPTAITNIKVNGEDPKENGDYEVFSGTTNNITFSVEPENAIGAKSIGISTRTDYATLSDDGFGIVIDHDMPGDSILRVIISAGDIKKTIRLHVTSLCNVELRLNGGTLPSQVQESLRNLPSGTWVESPQAPLREGYTFLGWYVNSGLTEAYEECAIETDFNLYAKWEVKKPKASFETGFNDVTVADVYTTYKAAITKPKDPTKFGYTFLGWYVDEVYSALYDFATILVDDITLYAKWEMIEYTFTFVPNGGTPIPTQTTTIMQDFCLLYQPMTTRAYYRFNGWYTDEELQQKFNLGDSITADTTLYAKWDAKQVTVHLLDIDTYEPLIDKWGVTIADKKTDFTKDFKISAVPTPEKAGCSFNCWWYSSKNIELADLETATFDPEDDEYFVTVYATWTPNKYTLTYVANLGAGEEEVESVECEYESNISPIEGPDREGYTFKRWKYGTQEVPALMPAKDITLTAVYEVNNYKLIYRVDGKIEEQESYAYGATIEYKEIEDFFSFDYLSTNTFSGWSWNGVGKLPTTMPASNVTVSGVFDGVKRTVHYVVEGDSSYNKDESVNYKDVIPEYVPEKAGYDFAGWTYADEDAPTVMPNQDITLRGHFAKKVYTVKLDKNGGSGDRTATVSIEEAMSAFDAITYTGRTLDGYYTARASGTLVVTKEGDLVAGVAGYTNDDGLWSKAGGATLYAHWTINTYDVIYNGNMPSNASSNVTSVPAKATWTYDDNATLAAAPVLEGWKFEGWYREATCKTFVGTAGASLYRPNLTAEAAGEVTLYAKWTAYKYTVVYDGNKPNNASGSVSNTPNATWTYDNDGTLATAPTLTGWTCVGWYSDPELKVYVGASGATLTRPNLVVPSEQSENNNSITLYAKWVANKYIVIYDGNKPEKASHMVSGIPAESEWAYDATNTLAGDKPTLTGWKFLGWYKEPTCTNKIGDEGGSYEKNLTSDQSVTLYAKWEAIQSIISFDTRGGNTINQMTVTYDDQQNLPVATYKESRQFEYWCTDPDATQRFTGQLAYVERDMVLYAKWKAVPKEVCNKTLRTESIQIRGSSNYTEDKITFNTTIADLKNKGYTKLVVKVSYELSEIDDCYQTVSLYNSSKTFESTKFSHGGFTNYSYVSGLWDWNRFGDTSWKWYDLEVVVNLNEVDNSGLSFKIQAEPDKYRDFYVRGVKAIVTAMP